MIVLTDNRCMVLLGAAVSAFGLRSARPAGPQEVRAPAARYEADDGVPGQVLDRLCGAA
ncbi:hypothetical protein ABZ499_10380 [Streptomyces sp. NPDC019990]|uniref:hypothetical protein n=1 Tax=Streptomyces sp. NPDC019990 TaxID=3154693 RepID=UPI0033DDAE6D